MNLFIEIQQDVIKKLLGARVDFIIIGGYSVIFHGYHRTTGDVDIWLRPGNDNKQKLLSALRELGCDEDEIRQVAETDFTRHAAFSMGEKPEKIDFLTRISQVEYDEADKRKIIAMIDGLPIPFLHLDDLVLSKINTGRPQDKADIDILQKIRNAKNIKP